MNQATPSPSAELSPSPLALIGAALPAAGRPLSPQDFQKLLGLEPDTVLRHLQDYDRLLDSLGGGFRLEAVAGGYRLYVPSELAQHLAPVLAPPPLPALSSAALEVLAIVAYRQPVTRAEIEAMRGGSASTLMTLQERELIKVAGRSEAVGQPLLYATTDKFLLEFGLASLAELPPLEEGDFSQLLRS